MVFCVRHMLWKIAMEKYVDIFGIMILNVVFMKLFWFF